MNEIINGHKAWITADRKTQVLYLASPNTLVEYYKRSDGRWAKDGNLYESTVSPENVDALMTEYFSVIDQPAKRV